MDGIRVVTPAAAASLILFTAMLVYGANAFWIYPEQNDTAPIHYLSPRMRFIDPPAPTGYWDSVKIAGEWIYLHDLDSNANLTGKIVCYNLKPTESQEAAARKLKNTGVLALFTLFRTTSRYPGAGNWVRTGERPGQSFPLFEITKKQNDSLAGWYTNQTRIWVVIDFDNNPWDNTFKYALPTLGIFILVFSGIICIIATFKLTLIILVHGFQLSMAQVVLWINIIGCILRMIFGAVDPFGSFEETSFVFTQIFLTISYPACVAGALLISLYWHEMIQRSGAKVHMFLNRMKWPFIGVTAFMFLFELATATLRGLNYNFTIMLFVDGGMYIIVFIGVFIFFIITRYRLQRIFDNLNRHLNTKRGQRLSLATTQLQIMVGTMVFFIVLLVLIGATDIVWTPISFPILWGIFFLTLQLISLLQVMLINYPRIRWRQLLCLQTAVENEALFKTNVTTGSPTASRTATMPSLSTVSTSSHAMEPLE